MNHNPFALIALLAVCAVANFFSADGAHAAAAGGDFSFDDLKSLLEEKSVRSIDELLLRLPTDYSKYYTFLYESRSLQKDFTSHLSPRALIYGPDAKLMMTYTEAARGSAQDNLEVLSWSDRESRFTLHEISFTPNGPQVSPDNPARCLKCHGSSIRAIFDPYRMWPGAYGSLSRQGRDLMGARTPEAFMYSEFIKGPRYSGRYRALPHEIELGPQVPDPQQRLTFSNGAIKNPNEYLTQKLVQLNSLRTGEWIYGSVRFERFKYALKAYNDGCFKDIGVDPFLPLTLRSAPSFDSVFEDTRAEIDRTFRDRLRRTLEHNQVTGVKLKNFPLQSEALRKTARFRYLLLKMGLDPAEARVAFEAGAYDLSTGNEQLQDVHYVDIIELSLRKALSHDRAFGKMSCDELKRASLAALSDAPIPEPSEAIAPTQSPESQRQTTAKLFAETCMTCHSGKFAPKLPLDSEASLQLALHRSPGFLQSLRDHLTGQNGAEPMPLGDPLPATQVRQLLDYLELLSRN